MLLALQSFVMMAGRVCFYRGNEKKGPTPFAKEEFAASHIRPSEAPLTGPDRTDRQQSSSPLPIGNSYHPIDHTARCYRSIRASHPHIGISLLVALLKLL